MTAPLLLDEMLSPGIAEALRAQGHDVLALVADPGLRGMPDDEVLTWAVARGRRVVTENVRDVAPLVASVEGPGVLFLSSRTFPRRRRDLGPVVDALDAWLRAPADRGPVEWLRPSEANG